jgi:UDP-N-acetyl-D-galactosamine dehydrogenase
LKAFSLNVHVTDPHAESKDLMHEYSFELTPELSNDYDAVLVTVPHEDYKKLDDSYFASITKEHAMVADLKGIYRGKITSRKYWSL